MAERRHCWHPRRSTRALSVDATEAEFSVVGSTAGSPRGPLFAGAGYAAASIGQRAPALLLLPLYTRALSPEDFGQLSLLMAIAIAVGFLLSFGLETAIFRAWFQHEGDPARRQQWLTTVATFMLVGPAVGGLLIIAAFSAVPGDPFGVPNGWIALAVACAALGSMTTVLPFALLRAQERLSAYIALSLIFAATNAAATVTAVVILRWGVPGWLLGTIVGYALTLAVAARITPWPSLRRNLLSRPDLTAALAFGIPLIPHFAANWTLQLSDRFLLAGLVSFSSLGIYSLAANLAISVLLVTSGLAQGTMPSYARARVVAAARGELTQMITNQVRIALLTGLLGALLLPLFVTELLPADYRAAAALCPWLSLAFTLGGLYFIPMNVISLMAGKTAWAWLASGTGAAVNLALIALFVPSQGLVAAAVATAVGYAVLLLTISAYASRAASEMVAYDWPAVVQGALIAVAAYAIPASLTTDSGLASTAIRAASILAAALFMFGRHGSRDLRDRASRLVAGQRAS